MNLQYITSSRFLTFDIIHGGDFPGRPSALRSLHMVYSSADSVRRGKTDTKSAACARGLARTSDSALSEEKRQANLWRSALAWLGHLVAEAGAHAKPHENWKDMHKETNAHRTLGIAERKRLYVLISESHLYAKKILSTQVHTNYICNLISWVHCKTDFSKW